MLYIFIAKPPTVLADRQSYTMAGRSVVCAGVLCVQSLNWTAAFYAYWHIGGREEGGKTLLIAAPIVTGSWRFKRHCLLRRTGAGLEGVDAVASVHAASCGRLQRP